MNDSFQAKHGGVIQETQQLPDAINRDNVGLIGLNIELVSRSQTVFNLSIRN